MIKRVYRYNVFGLTVNDSVADFTVSHLLDYSITLFFHPIWSLFSPQVAPFLIVGVVASFRHIHENEIILF